MSEEKIERKLKENERTKELERIRGWIEERRKKFAEAGEAQVSEGDAPNTDLKSKDGQIGDDHDRKIVDLKLQVSLHRIQKEIAIENERLSNCSKTSNEYSKINMRLNYLNAIQWKPERYEPVDLKKARGILDADHYGMNALKTEILEYIHANNKLGKISHEILLLSGPPGTGKTSIARQIAKAMGRELCKLPLGGLNDEIFIKGSVRQYGNSKPGAIIDILFRAGHRKLVILLDEIDKMGNRYGNNDGAASLLDVLDNDNCFIDRFLDVPVDLSDIVFIATANETKTIAPALLDRMSELEILPYSKEEKYFICQKHLLPRTKEEYGIQGNSLRIDRRVLERLAEDDYENAGIRSLTHKVRKLCRMVSKNLLESGKASYNLSLKRAVGLGIISDRPHGQIIKTKIGRVVTSGMDFTSGKESLLEIEALLAEDRKDPIVIGDNSRAYQDVANQMAGYMAANHKELNISETKIKNYSFLLFTANLSRLKFDSNHKFAIFCSIYSAFRTIALPENYIVLGDVTLLGEVRSNSLTRTYIMSALNYGAKALIVPKDLEHSLSGVVTNKNSKFYFIEDLTELSSLYQTFALRKKIQQRFSHAGQATESVTLQKHEQEIMAIAKKKNISESAAFKLHFDTKTVKGEVDAEDQLTKLIGLTQVKTLLQEIVAWKEVTQKRKQSGLISKNIGLHMAFTGNPGTGKTTVAKILGEMLYKKGLVKSDVFVEVTRDDLVGKYIGHTEERVGKVIRQALGGVLYIDEAHSLYMESENDYGQVVLSTVVKAMEEHREDLVIIMSGYKEEMLKMIKLNPGLTDRINFKLDFGDYSIDELLEILTLMCDAENYELEDCALIYFRERMKEYVNKRSKNKNFSNGRFVRNIFEKAKIKQAIRIGLNREIVEENYRLLTGEDLKNAYEQEQGSRLTEREIQMGF